MTLQLSEIQTGFLLVTVLVSCCLVLWAVGIVIPSRNQTISYYKDRNQTLEYWVNEIKTVTDRQNRIADQAADNTKKINEQLTKTCQQQADEILVLETNLADRDLLLSRIKAIAFEPHSLPGKVSDLKNALVTILSSYELKTVGE